MLGGQEGKSESEESIQKMWLQHEKVNGSDYLLI